jgi:hypothetical protein
MTRKFVSRRESRGHDNETNLTSCAAPAAPDVTAALELRRLLGICDADDLTHSAAA